METPAVQAANRRFVQMLFLFLSFLSFSFFFFYPWCLFPSPHFRRRPGCAARGSASCRARSCSPQGRAEGQRHRSACRTGHRRPVRKLWEPRRMRTLTSSELRFGTGLKPEAVSCFLMTETKRRNKNKNNKKKHLQNKTNGRVCAVSKIFHLSWHPFFVHSQKVILTSKDLLKAWWNIKEKYSWNKEFITWLHQSMVRGGVGMICS